MTCRECDRTNEGQDGIAYYRWKNAIVGIAGCRKHVAEICEVLKEYQLKEDS